jgi:hypothetical protein
MESCRTGRAKNANLHIFIVPPALEQHIARVESGIYGLFTASPGLASSVQEDSESPKVRREFWTHFYAPKTASPENLKS